MEFTLRHRIYIVVAALMLSALIVVFVLPVVRGNVKAAQQRPDTPAGEPSELSSPQDENDAQPAYVAADGTELDRPIEPTQSTTVGTLLGSPVTTEAEVLGPQVSSDASQDTTATESTAPAPGPDTTASTTPSTYVFDTNNVPEDAILQNQAADQALDFVLEYWTVGAGESVAEWQARVGAYANGDVRTGIVREEFEPGVSQTAKNPIITAEDTTADWAKFEIESLVSVYRDGVAVENATEVPITLWLTLRKYEAGWLVVNFY